MWATQYHSTQRIIKCGSNLNFISLLLFNSMYIEANPSHTIYIIKRTRREEIQRAKTDSTQIRAISRIGNSPRFTPFGFLFSLLLYGNTHTRARTGKQALGDIQKPADKGRWELWNSTMLSPAALCRRYISIMKIETTEFSSSQISPVLQQHFFPLFAADYSSLWVIRYMFARSKRLQPVLERVHSRWRFI